MTDLRSSLLASIEQHDAEATRWSSGERSLEDVTAEMLRLYRWREASMAAERYRVLRFLRARRAFRQRFIRRYRR